MTYRISNSDIGLGLILFWPAMFFLNLNILSITSLFLLIVSSIFIGLFGLVGMGDVKLFLIFAPWLRPESWLSATTVLIAFTWVQIAIFMIRDRSFPQKVAFAPAILLAVAVNMAS
jgi:Flp pilus assembly protein protease CpaA